jgi:signal recognition particle subunit SRP54
LDDFRRLLDEAQRAGPLGKGTGLLPGVSKTEEKVERETQRQLQRVKGIIDAMTPEERRAPDDVLDESRLRRIAAGAGVEPREVRDLARQFHGMAEIMDQLSRAGPPWGEPL